MILCRARAEEIPGDAAVCPYCQEPTFRTCPHCAAPLPPLVRECPFCARDVAGPVAPTPEEAAAMRERKSRFLARAWCLGVLGLGLQILSVNRPLAYSDWGALAFLGGIALFVPGLGFFARSKGRAFLWGLLGILSCVGWIVIFCLNPSCPQCRARVLGAFRECPSCTAPI